MKIQKILWQFTSNLLQHNPTAFFYVNKAKNHVQKNTWAIMLRLPKPEHVEGLFLMKKTYGK